MNRDELLNLQDSKVSELEVPVWGKVHLKSWCGNTRDKFENLGREKKLTRAWIVASTLCDAKGNLLFNPNDKKDIELLGAKNYEALEAICNYAMGLKLDDEKKT